MAITLRLYQERSISEIREALIRYRRVLFQLPTGGGKTICFAYIAASSQKIKRKVLILSNRTEILTQNGGALERLGLEVDIIDRYHKKIPTSNICVGMAQTIRRRLEKPEWREYLSTIQLCIVDEAHCCDFDFIYPYLNERCFRLLVTATPQRQGKQNQLGEIVKAMVTGVSVKELVGSGYLAKARHFTVAAPRLDDVEIDSGTKEYNQKSLARKYEDKTLYYGVLDEWQRLCPDKKTIVFCVSSEQAIEFTRLLVERGVKAKYVLSGTFEDDSAYSGNRSKVIDGFKNNEFQVLVNVGIAVAGMDVVDVECIVANFATTSMSKWRQAIGRGSRMCEGKKEFFILDAGDNIRRLGMFDADIEWSLWHDVSSGGGLQVMKKCPTDKIDINHRKGCGALIPSTCSYCPCCGYKFVTEKDAVQLHLEEVAEGETEDLSAWAAQKKLEGWKLSRILVNVCLSNIGQEQKAFVQVYRTLYPAKSEREARAYWYSFNKNIWSNIKRKQQKQA